MLKYLAIAVIGVAGMALAPVHAPLHAQEAEEGRSIFMQHCATCHGLEADGKGPMAPVLLVQPKDLSRLSIDNKGEFPLMRVVMRIDGRDPLVSHGSSMPVYGAFFQGDDVAMKTGAGQPVMMGRPIADLVAYLQEIQQ